MTSVDRKRILFVSRRKEAEPLLGQLRAAGHHVSLVDDLDQASTLLAAGEFDETLIPAGTFLPVLTQNALLAGSDADSWRRSTVAIAHDLRRLLASLDVLIQPATLAETLAVPHADIAEAARTIKMLSVFLSELTEELDRAPGTGLTLSRFDLEDTVESAAMAVYPSASDRRQRLVIDVEASVAVVVADRIKLKRVLTSLLAHASAQSRRSGTITIHARRDLDECILSVSYRGEPLGTAELGELFRRAPADSRTGLHAVRGLVEAHGGRLWIESEKNTGTSIFVSFPSPGVVPGESAALTTAS